MTQFVETPAQALMLFEEVGMPARNLASRTRQEYSRDLERLLAFLEKRGLTRIDQVTLPHLEAYQARLDQQGYKVSTRNRKICAIWDSDLILP